MTQTLRDLMEQEDSEPDQHVRETFEVEDASELLVPVDIIGHYDGPADSQPDTTEVRIWDPQTTQPFEERPYSPALLHHQETIENYRDVPRRVNVLLDQLQTNGVQFFIDDD